MSYAFFMQEGAVPAFIRADCNECFGKSGISGGAGRRHSR